MLRIYIFRVCKGENRAEHPRANAGAPLAYFQKKAESESGERRELTLLEGELLSFAMARENTSAKPSDSLEKGKFGKLRFAKSGENEPKTEFSFSHSGEVLALSISENGAVGIDVEENKSEYSTGVEEKFLSGFYPEYSYVNAEIYEVYRDGEGLSCAPIDGALPPSGDADFFSRWTAMEALLKMQGEGLSAYKRAREIMEVADLFAFECEVGEKSYTVTVAREKQTT